MRGVREADLIDRHAPALSWSSQPRSVRRRQGQRNGWHWRPSQVACRGNLRDHRRGCRRQSRDAPKTWQAELREHRVAVECRATSSLVGQLVVDGQHLQLETGAVKACSASVVVKTGGAAGMAGTSCRRC